VQLGDPAPQPAMPGTVQATISTGDEPVAEVAWVVGISWQGQGIATEAARALISWLGHQSVHAVIAHIHHATTPPPRSPPPPDSLPPASWKTER
jgi:RimJ/RimL family protein N-acetyltransferase